MHSYFPVVYTNLRPNTIQLLLLVGLLGGLVGDDLVPVAGDGRHDHDGGSEAQRLGELGHHPGNREGAN